jgi:hypothetical protein
MIPFGVRYTVNSVARAQPKRKITASGTILHTCMSGLELGYLVGWPISGPLLLLLSHTSTALGLIAISSLKLSLALNTYEPSRELRRLFRNTNWNRARQRVVPKTKKIISI